MTGRSAAPDAGPSAGGTSSRGTAARLVRLQRTLTLIFAALSLAGTVLFAGTIALLDREDARERLTLSLRVAAARGAAMVWMDDQGEHTEGLVGDAVVDEAGGLTLVEQSATGELRTLYHRGTADLDLLAGVLRASLQDRSEAGVASEITRPDGTRLLAVAMPVWSDSRISGSIVASADLAAIPLSPFFTPALLGGLLLTAALTLLVWKLVGRSVRPVIDDLMDREHFLASAAHELRGPMARLRAGAEAAYRSTAPNDPSARKLRNLITVADAAGRVVSNILLASRVEHAEVPLRHEVVRLDKLAGDVEQAFDSLVVDIREIVSVPGDPGLLRHAVINLVDNALRHGRVGEEVPTVVLSVLRYDGRPVIRVADDGPGFSPDVDVLSRFSTGPHSGGTGLGLPLVQWIAARHDATVHLGGAFPIPDTTGVWSDGPPGAVVDIVFPDDTSLSAPHFSAAPADPVG